MRTKIDYGIDLGTTNSTIARMEKETAHENSNMDKNFVSAALLTEILKNITIEQGHENQWKCVANLADVLHKILSIMLQKGEVIEKTEVRADCFNYAYKVMADQLLIN